MKDVLVPCINVRNINEKRASLLLLSVKDFST